MDINEVDQLLDLELIQKAKDKHEKENEIPFTIGLVFYVDGGADNNLKYGSFGIHGYLYCNSIPKRGTGIKGYIASDIGYILNERLTHKYECFPINGTETIQIEPTMVTGLYYINCFGSLLEATNNVAEITAVIKSLELVKRFADNFTISAVHIRSDSKYCLDGIRNREAMIQRNWTRRDGTPIANLELWQEFVPLINECSNLGIAKINFEWVKGHSDFFGNIQADMLATKGKVIASNSQEIHDISIKPCQGFWSDKANKIELSYLLADSKWYTRPHDPLIYTEDGLNVLFLGTHKEDKRVGQQLAEHFNAVVYIKDLPQSFNLLRDVAGRFDKVETGFDVSGLYSTNLSMFSKTDVKESIDAEDEYLIKANHETKKIKTYKDTEITVRLPLDGLCLQAYERWKFLITLLDIVRSGDLPKGYYLNDVTDQIYEEVSKGKKTETKCLLTDNYVFKPTVKVDALEIDPNDSTNYVNVIRETELTVSFGITAPVSRVFSGIKDQKPKVYILTIFEPFVSVRFFTVIMLENGDCGIWTNMAANQKTIY